MRAVDVNVLIYAFDSDATHHQSAVRVLRECADTAEPLVLFPAVMVGFLRVVTDRRILRTPASPVEAKHFLDQLLKWPTVRVVADGNRWWDSCGPLLVRHEPRGAEVVDVSLAAAAMAHGATWISFDRGFARFDGLRWINPADRVVEA
jgi:hypothetical protein